MICFFRQTQSLLRVRATQHGEALVGSTILYRRTTEMIFAEEDSFQCLERLRRFCVDAKLAVELYERLFYELSVRFVVADGKTSSQLALLRRVLRYTQTKYLCVHHPCRDSDVRMWLRPSIAALYQLVASSSFHELSMTSSFRCDFLVLLQNLLGAAKALYLSAHLRKSILLKF